MSRLQIAILAKTWQNVNTKIYIGLFCQYIIISVIACVRKRGYNSINTDKMKIRILRNSQPDFPEALRDIPQSPVQIYVLGNLDELLALPRLAVVGSRKVSPYGKAVTTKLAGEAAGRGIVIVSGLALGVDGLAHQAALQAGGKTIAVLPAGLDKIYPATHRQLAMKILEQGGALVTEYPDGTEPFKTNFLERNRLIAGLSDAVMITEAAERSGSLNTANHALEQGRTVMAVPGNITSLLSVGTNNLIKAGAQPVTSISDIADALGVRGQKPQMELFGNNPEEAKLLCLIQQGASDAGELLHQSKLEPAVFNQTLTMLELTGRIRPLGNGHWSLA